MTTIEWTWPPWVDQGKTLNYIIGCTHAGGPGCDNCWAEADTWIRQNNPNPKMAKANAGLTVMRPNGRPRWTSRVNKIPERLTVPLKTRKRWGIFAPSKSDPFHESLMADEAGRRFVAAAFGMAAATPQHTYFFLTKRTDAAARWFEWLRDRARARGVSPARVCLSELVAQLEDLDEHRVAEKARAAHDPAWPLPNVWILASTENQATFDERIDGLRRLDAAVRGLSVEPMLGPVRLGEHAKHLDWVVCGGESGPRARPMHPDWARALRDECVATGTRFFFKQWGTWGPTAARLGSGDPVFRTFTSKIDWIEGLALLDQHATKGDACVDLSGRVLRRGADFDVAEYPVAVLGRLGKGRAGRILDGRTWEQFPAEPS